MKVLQLYNNYRSGGGGETVMAQYSADLLRRNGHTVISEWKDNHTIRGLQGSLRAFASGIYSPSARALVTQLLKEYRPDVVHIFNLFPLFSPSVIQACNALQVPVLMSVQNHQLTCPTAAHFTGGQVCERCLTGSEYQCILHNCKENALQSIGYALRSAVARRQGWFHEGVTTFLAISETVQSRMLRAGYDGAKIRILPNCVPVPEQILDPKRGSYVAFLGRLSAEKGILVLLEAAKMTGIPVRIAGSGDQREELVTKSSSNVTFHGWLGRDGVADFYAGARFTVVPSVWPEPFGLVATEAMSYGLPVIAARSGGLAEIVTHGETGLLYEPANAEELAEHMLRLWNAKEECGRLGANARRSVKARYNDDVYYDGLVSAFEDALAGRGTVLSSAEASYDPVPG